MFRTLLITCLLIQLAPGQGPKAGQDANLVQQLRQVYSGWRTAVVRKDAVSWQRFTSSNRLTSIKNRLLSERRRFPQAFFNLPASPPDLNTLKALRVRVKGPTVKAIYFGKVDFGIGGKPTENILTVSYVQERTGWKYEGSEFINLNALPDVRKQIQAGDYKYVDQPAFQPDGIIAKPGITLTGAAQYIAKAYVYCPGREVNLVVNKISPHTFQNTKQAEIILGGARDGNNEVRFTVKDIPGGDPKSPMTIRVYLMSQIQGVKPIKALEYQVTDGKAPEKSGLRHFLVTPEMAKKLR
ncbi:hypothetical protein N9873_03460 [Akkermansiaceae bacterium]|nr:hypothetical protein [bacterium]MDB4271574.1 hypothetical protein [Akkermansiaceae bacterium]MDB4273268.1 hypothetical protein [Akkermansiaceae bacterium]MDB4294603.1 hypothetical protein [Akkermansiaceae bacterium]MDB4615098.1 hypothetical protein [Akkermansiaceae bacterium]